MGHKHGTLSKWIQSVKMRPMNRTLHRMHTKFVQTGLEPGSILHRHHLYMLVEARKEVDFMAMPFLQRSKKGVLLLLISTLDYRK